MNKTQNYQLNQWEATDKVQRVDFNADNAKIDAAMTTEAQAREALAQTVAGHTATLSHKGNCQLYTTSYVGDGRNGSNTPNSLTFPRRPLVVFIDGSTDVVAMLQGSPTFHLQSWYSQVSWSGNTVTWYCDYSEATQLNVKDRTYTAIALLSMD